MIKLNVIQGSREWLDARVGIPTGSQFDKILTQVTMKASKQAEDYLNNLVAEYLIGEPLESVMTPFMARGLELEDEASDYYEFQTGTEPETIGFCLRDDRLVGCSPDRLVGNDGGLEIKCPAPGTHIGYLRNNDKLRDKYRAQVQGFLWITGRKWCDLLSYHPTIHSLILRCERDTEFIDAVELHVGGFIKTLEQVKQEIMAKYGQEQRNAA